MTDFAGARGDSPEKAAAVHVQPPSGAGMGQGLLAQGAARLPGGGSLEAKPDNVTGTFDPDAVHAFDQLADALRAYVDLYGGCVESARKAVLQDLDTAAILEWNLRRAA